MNPSAMRRRRGRWSLVFLSFAMALFLMIIPLPDWMRYARPDWLSLVLFYWCLALPERVGVFTGWASGLMLDLLRFSLLGQHALGKALVALVANLAHQRLRMYHLWQQCIVIFFVVLVDHSLMLWIQQLSGGQVFDLRYLIAVITTTMLWPVVYTVLRGVRQRGNIS